MIPDKPLPYSDEFASADEYVESLLDFANTTDIFQMLSGGVHLLDFFTADRSLYEMSLPPDWQSYILALEPMAFVDLLLRDDIDSLPEASRPPPTLAKYIKDVRRLCLRRSYNPPREVPQLKRPVAVGMRPKKLHEVANFADYVDRLANDVEAAYDKRITHLVDFGSGQNYLGRTLALPPYNRHVVAVEGEQHNIDMSRHFDMLAGLSTREKVHRNKKAWLQHVDSQTPEAELKLDRRALARAARSHKVVDDPEADLRPVKQLAREYVREPGMGSVSYVVSRLESGDLTDVIAKVEDEVVLHDDEVDGVVEGKGDDSGESEKEARNKESGENGDCDATKTEEQTGEEKKPDTTTATTIAATASTTSRKTSKKDLKMMAVSIHSCGNLSHYGIRSLIMNPGIHAVAIVGCCYNLLTEKLGPPTYKFPYVRPSLQAVNGRVFDESHRFDSQGFPISERLSTYKGHGVRFNVTARMMACQAPYNWSYEESRHFFMRNAYRATLQRMLLDRGVIKRVYFRKGMGGQEPEEKQGAEEESEKQPQSGTGTARSGGDDQDEADAERKEESKGEGEGAAGQTGTNDKNPSVSPFDTSTDPVILGSLNKSCYNSFKQYVRGAVDKLATHREWNKYEGIVKAKMADITDEEIDAYEDAYVSRGREVAAIWSLMAFSATVVESLIATDRWLFLKEHADVVKDCWVENVFDYGQSPRNLVVVGIKK